MSEDSFLKRSINRQLAGFSLSDGEHEWKGEFTFVQAADTQFGLIERYIEKRPPPWKWTEETRLAELAVQCVNSLKPRPRFMVVCGDLIDAMPGAEDRKDQIKEFFRIFRQLSPDIPLVCVCGNHDIGDAPTPEGVKSYTDTFGDDYFSFWVGGVKFLVLNSQFYKDSSQCCELKRAQDEWLDKELASENNAKCKHLIVFQHIPWFLKEPNEADDYFNIEKTTRAIMLEKLSAAGVRTIFCGHYHQNAGGWYENANLSGTPHMELVVTSAIGGQIGNDKSGLRIVRVLENGVRHEYHPLEECRS